MAEFSKFISISRGNFNKEQIIFRGHDFPLVSELLDSAGDCEIDSEYRKLVEFGKGFFDFGSCPIPDTLKGSLRPYQQNGFNWLMALNQTRFNGILADDMGLGKTLQVLTLLLSLKDGYPFSPSLLVVPKTLIHNWEIEIKKFAPSLKYILHTGSKRTKEPGDYRDWDAVITSYGLIRQDFDLLRKIQWYYLILDEAQAIKNPTAKITRAIKRLSADHRLSLSGTPVENTPIDLWSHFDFLMPGMLGSLRDFKQRYNRDSPEDLAELHLRTKPFILRRLKKQVCNELPSKTEVTLYCPFGEEQKKVYDDALRNARSQIVDRKEKKINLSVHLLTLLLILRQLACDHGLIRESDDLTPTDSGKHETVLETGEAILSQGHKILIFSQFVGHLKRIKEGFDRKRFKSFYLDGSTMDRKGEIRRFQNHSKPCVFFISLKAGGLGLNLTEANYAFLLDPWWNPAVENQAIDRCYRIGQEKAVTIYRFITKDSIEEKVIALKKVKEDIQEIVIQESDMEDTHLTKEQLEGLLFD
jgi:SNF2 family DNA or RNA helicase